MLSLGHLALLCGYTLTLALCWFAGNRLARLLLNDTTVGMRILHIIKPILTLMTLVLGYDVIAIALDPFLSPGGRAFYGYVVALGTCGSALWLIIACGWVVRSYPVQDESHATLRVRERDLENGLGCRGLGARLDQRWEAGSGSRDRAGAGIAVDVRR